MIDLSEKLYTDRLIAIARGFDTAVLIPAAEALVRGGFSFIETTFSHPGENDAETAGRIAALAEAVGSSAVIGAGTVLTVEQVALAHSAGAKFIVSPNTDARVIEKTKSLGMLSLPGAYTPTEIILAHSLGADFVKVFPVSADYIRLVRAPAPYIKLIAVGGVDLTNLIKLLSAGACAAAIGGALLDKAAVLSGDTEAIEYNALRFSAIARSFN